MRLYLPAPIRDPLLGAISRLEISFDVQVSLKRVRRYGWKWSRDWEYAVDLAVRPPTHRLELVPKSRGRARFGTAFLGGEFEYGGGSFASWGQHGVPRAHWQRYLGSGCA